MEIFNQKELITEELINSFVKSFKYVDVKKRKISPTRIRVNGQFITTLSNKTVWQSLGAAKNALRNHVYSTARYGSVIYENYNFVIDSLVEKGILEFVQVSETFEVIRQGNP